MGILWSADGERLADLKVASPLPSSIAPHLGGWGKGSIFDPSDLEHQALSVEIGCSNCLGRDKAQWSS
jgi:hypothetical protein